jgi:hypothetical protein
MRARGCTYPTARSSSTHPKVPFRTTDSVRSGARAWRRATLLTAGDTGSFSIADSATPYASVKACFAYSGEAYANLSPQKMRRCASLMCLS